MKKQRNYFILNKRSDYEKSAFENMDYDENGIWIPADSVKNRGVFLSRIFDSREPEMEWHRLVLKVTDASDAPYRVMIYTAEEAVVKWKNEKVPISSLIGNTEISMEEKLKVLEPFCKKSMTGKSDILLHEVKGRYLWISLEVYKQFGQSLKFENMTAYFPKKSWLSYLPELYEASDTEHFLDHYLSVFQSVYDDLNQSIEEIPYLLDVDTTKTKYLDALCQWIGVTKSQMWPDEKKRVLLSEAVDLFKIRGTRAGIMKVLRLYLEDEVFLIEKHQWKQAHLTESRKRLYESLYGASSYTITVLVKEESVPSRKEYQTLLQVIRSVKPAQADLNLVVLKPYLFLDGHSYLGVNSVLGKYRDASLDGKSVLALTAIGKGTQEPNQSPIGRMQQKERLNNEEY